MLIVNSCVNFLSLEPADQAKAQTEGGPVPLVLLSGGLDSTYLAYEFLKAGDIDILYIDSRQTSNKVNAEKKALQTIVHTLNANSEHKIRNCFLASAVDLGFVRMQFQQAGYWIFSALQAFDDRLHNKVCMSYVSGDSILASLSGIKSAWWDLASSIKMQPIPLEFPLQFVTKAQILTRMPQQLIDLTWSCENPISDAAFIGYEACGYCDPCVTKKVELYRQSLLRGSKT